jgi:hypothetical protein
MASRTAAAAIAGQTENRVYGKAKTHVKHVFRHWLWFDSIELIHHSVH